MANTLSDILGNALASPSVPNDVRIDHGNLRVKVAEVAVAAADNDGHIYPLARFKATDRIIQAYLTNTAITSGTAYDLGVFAAGNWNDADQSAIDADCLFDGQSMATARDIWTNLIGAGTNAPNAGEFADPLWSQAGVAAEPEAGTRYDVALTGATVGSAAGTIQVAFLYVTGD